MFVLQVAGSARALLSAALVALCPSGPFAQTPQTPSNLHPASLQTRIEVTPELQGDLLSARQKYVEAIAAYQKASQDSATVANKMGVAYHHMFDYADAKRCYERAIKLNSHYPEAYNNLGAVYHAQKDYKQAVRYYKKAIKLDPKSPMFFSNLGTAYFFDGKVKKGAAAYATALSLDRNVFDINAPSRVEEASSTKELATVNYFLARTYAQAGMKDRALLYLKKAIDEGFSDRKKLMDDKEFASLHDMPEFQQLVSPDNKF